MNTIKTTILVILIISVNIITLFSQNIIVTSPDKNISVTVINAETLSYSVEYNGCMIINPSLLGFEFQGEEDLDSNFAITGQKIETINETWKPVVKSKHAEIANNYNELQLNLKEKTGSFRQLDFFVRAYDDGVAFRYKLYRSEKIGDRKIIREKTTFSIPGDPKAWIVNYGGYSSSQESEFYEHNVSFLNKKSIAGLPFLMDYGKDCSVAITEAKIDNYSAFYLGTTGTTGELTTKLVPALGESELGIKVRFDDDIYTPWRVILIGDSPGKLIESEIIKNLNAPCAIDDPSWITPGICAWDNWWSGEVKMEMPVIKQYIDFASEMGWKYMLIDWQWYGEFNSPQADITQWAPQINMPEIISYAKSKKIKIIVWLYSKDVNRNSAYKKAFPLYNKWGVAGIKIDFMDRDDQEMVRWYHDIIKCAAKNKLLVDFHGAYKPDGISRTYPNMITREGVMGNEYYKFSNKMSSEHNVKLAFTRMLAGQMDYTPGGFLNVTKEQYKNQNPTLVMNTRAAELSKFVIYESPLTVVCDHPDNILGQPGSDFLRIVPTVWDDTRFISGYPSDYIALARKNGDTWFIGIMNNSISKEIEIKLDFLPQGSYDMEVWADAKNANKKPKEIKQEKKTVNNGDSIKVVLAQNGGFVATIREKQLKKH